MDPKGAAAGAIQQREVKAAERWIITLIIFVAQLDEEIKGTGSVLCRTSSSRQENRVK